MNKVLLILVLLTVTGCSQDELLQKFAPKEDQAFAEHCIDLLINRRFDEFEQLSDTSIKSQNLRTTLQKMSDFFPTEKQTSIKLVGAHQSMSALYSAAASDHSYSTDLIYEYRFPTKLLLINVNIQRKNGHTGIVGFHVRPEDRGMEEQNRFHIGMDNSILALPMLLLAVFLPIFTIYTLIVCIRTELSGKKWPWIFFIIFGFGKITLNWTTGQFMIAPFFVQLLSASAIAEPYGPWMISISLPVGAIVFLRKMKQARLISNAPKEN
jgi:hypothetical protein